MMITTTSELEKFCQKLAKYPFITVDTEFIREKTYYPVLCLIQLGCSDAAACVDPLAPEMDLSPLFDLFLNKKVLKVFHAARQDLEIFYHLMGKMPTPLFDTQIAAMVCGYGDAVAYQQLVEQLTSTRLDKSMRFTDWAKRPLLDKQIGYALNDVIPLVEVYQKLTDELHQNGRMEWLKEEQDILNDSHTYQIEDATAWKRLKCPLKKPKEVHLFAALCAWREKTAKQKNRPRRHILKDEVIQELASIAPKTPEELDALRSIPRGFAKSETARSLLNAIQAALKDDPATFEKPTARKPLKPAQKSFLEMLKLLLTIVAQQEKVAAKVVASADDLYDFAAGDETVPFLKGWRFELFGQKAQSLRQGKLALIYRADKGIVEFKMLD